MSDKIITDRQTDRQTDKTGYPSIDKPWLKYYSEAAVNTPITKLSIYEYLCECNKDNMERTALVYMGRKISYQTMFESIEVVAKAFAKLGLAKGDTVACIAPSFPEVIYSFYAANKLGAVSDYFDPRSEAETIYKEIQQVKPKVMLIYEGFAPKFTEMISRAQIETVIVVSVKDSLPAAMKVLAGLKGRTKCPENWLSFAKFLKNAEGMRNTDTVTALANEVALMEHTGGTTGVPKAVCLTNQNVNAVAQQYELTGDRQSREDSWLGISFPFTAYGLICSQHLPLVYGMTLYTCYVMDADKIVKMVMKKRINHMANTPLVWEKILHNKKAQKTDFSFLINPTVGADTLATEKEVEINRFLKEHNCDETICKGYGMTECGSGVSMTVALTGNKLGSVGTPFVHTLISIFDTESGEELKYGEQGEICISGPTVMKGYFNNPEETQKVLRVHADGNVWLHSGDIGHMDEDGCLFIDGRIKRMIINHHGFKIFAPEIEHVFSKHSSVEKCCVVGAFDKEYQQGKIAVAFVILKKETRKTQTELEREFCEMCLNELPDYYVPSKFIFTDKFPYTSAAKVDYRELERQAECNTCV